MLMHEFFQKMACSKPIEALAVVSCFAPTLSFRPKTMQNLQEHDVTSTVPAPRAVKVMPNVTSCFFLELQPRH
jgi:hypothetical protein